MLTPVRFAALGLAMLLTSCSGGGGFSGSNGRTSVTNKAAEPEDNSANATNGGDDEGSQELGKSASSADIPSSSNGNKDNNKLGQNAPAENSQAPDSAVTKGSFTAWAEPPHPRPMQDYWIHVEVKLPANAANYQVTDLSGRLVGTDGYTRGIGRDSRGPTEGLPDWVKNHSGIKGAGAAESDKFQLNPGVAKISVFVPGAESLVRDTIQIYSDLLKEQQNLEIVFK